MFDNLVESSSNKDDIARKGSFIGLTIVIYGVVLLGFVVGSIYMVDAQMESQTQELETMVAPVPVQEVKPVEKVQPKQETKEITQDTRTELQARIDQPVKEPPTISTAKNSVPPATSRSKVGLTNDVAPPPTGPIGPSTGGTGTTGTVVSDDDDKPPPVAPKPPPPKTIVSGGVLNGKAISLPKPAYPPVAKAAHASGAVVVQVTIDEGGGVISASAVSGNPLLRAAAVGAARGARFSPTKLSGVPVKVTGTIIYNFAPQ
jgi:protein TonB